MTEFIKTSDYCYFDNLIPTSQPGGTRYSYFRKTAKPIAMASPGNLNSFTFVSLIFFLRNRKFYNILFILCCKHIAVHRTNSRQRVD